MRTITGSRDICVIFYHCELLSDKGSWFFKQLIFRFSCSTIFLSKYIFCVCVLLCGTSTDCCHVSRPYLGVALLFTETAFFGCLFVESSSSRPLPQNTFGYLLLRMYAPLPNLPKKELLKVIEKCLFAPSKIESLDLSRSLGRNTTMNGTIEGNVQEKHAYFFASSHVTVYRHVTQMYRSCSSPRHHF